MIVKTLERCFDERIDRKKSNIVYTVKNLIQNAILAAIDSIIAPKINNYQDTNHKHTVTEEQTRRDPKLTRFQRNHDNG